jgi:small-conductance mechanosensitive channel
MIDTATWDETLRHLAGAATPTQWATQAALAAGCILLAWLIARGVGARQAASPRRSFGYGEFRSVLFPFLAVVLVGLAVIVMGRLRHPVGLLQFVNPLLVALLLIRIAVYVLGYVLPPGGALRLAVRIIAWAAWIGVALHLTGLLPEVRSALDEIGFTVGKDQGRVTLLLVLQALVAIAVTMTVAMWLARLTSGRILAAQNVEMSTRVVVVKIINTVAVVLAVLVALPMAGIDITALSVFGGALGVGLGFGLQKVAASYVSGFIVLLERSLRIGDVITVENRRGVVEAIESRYTVIRAGDGTETILPNEVLITKDVVHHTYTDPKVATQLPVTVTYEADADRACALLTAIGRSNARVIADPHPVARVAALTDRGIQLELTVWINDPDRGDSDLRSELLKDILRTFRAEGIEFAYTRPEMRLIATPEIHENQGKTTA